MSLCSPENLSI